VSLVRGEDLSITEWSLRSESGAWGRPVYKWVKSAKWVWCVGKTCLWLREVCEVSLVRGEDLSVTAWSLRSESGAWGRPVSNRVKSAKWVWCVGKTCLWPSEVCEVSLVRGEDLSVTEWSLRSESGAWRRPVCDRVKSAKWVWCVGKTCLWPSEVCEVSLVRGEDLSITEWSLWSAVCVCVC